MICCLKRVSRLLDDFKNPVTSENKEVKNDVQSGGWFTYRRNNIGPITEPCCTPHKISLQEDSKLSSICEIISKP